MPRLSTKPATLPAKIPPRRRGIFSLGYSLAQQQDQDDQRDRDPDEPEKNGHELFLSGLKLAAGRTPGAVAKATAFSGSKAGAERTDQKRGHQPERQLGGSLAGSVSIAFDLRDDIVDALISIRLAQTGSRRNNLGDVSSVRRLQLTPVAKAGGEQAGHLTTRRFSRAGACRRRGVRTQQR